MPPGAKIPMTPALPAHFTPDKLGIAFDRLHSFNEIKPQ